MSDIHSDKIFLRSPIKLYSPSLPQEYDFLDENPNRFQVEVHHPGYSPTDSLLFTFYAWDHPNGGLHFNFVYCACLVIADNQEGYLSSSSGGAPIDAQPDSLLRAGANGIADSSYRWPVITSFHNWRFPSSIPQAFRRAVPSEFATNTGSLSSYSIALKLRDVNCRITQCYTSVESAHLFPQSEKDWFMANSMFRWNTNHRLPDEHMLNDLSNVMLLRSDLHKALDAGKFVFFPKSETEWVVHVLEITEDLAKLYHNTILHSISYCSLEFLYARFAWAIFPSIAGFIKPSISRLVKIAQVTDHGINYIIKEVSHPDQAKAQLSPTPKPNQRFGKRPHSFEQQGENYDHFEEDGFRKRQEHLTDSSVNQMDENDGQNTISISTESTPSSAQKLNQSIKKSSELNSNQGTSIPSDEDFDGGKLEHLRQKFMLSGRPQNYVPMDGKAFDQLTDPKEIMLALGADIIDD